MNLSLRKVLGNGNEFGRIRVVHDHFCENGSHG